MLHKKNTFAAVDPFVQKNRLASGFIRIVMLKQI